MPDFNAKMHQNRFQLGLRPKPRWGSLQRSPDPLAGFKGPTSKGRRRQGRGGEGTRLGIKGEAFRHFSFYNLTTGQNRQNQHKLHSRSATSGVSVCYSLILSENY